MKEMILVCNLQDREKRLKVERALIPLKIRLKKIQKEEYGHPLGALAGVKDIPVPEDVYDGEELPGPMFVFAFLSHERLGQVLAALRKSGAGPFPYKAVLTETNQHWTVAQCFAEIKREHEALHP